MLSDVANALESDFTEESDALLILRARVAPNLGNTTRTRDIDDIFNELAPDAITSSSWYHAEPANPPKIGIVLRDREAYWIIAVIGDPDRVGILSDKIAHEVFRVSCQLRVTRLLVVYLKRLDNNSE